MARDCTPQFVCVYCGDDARLGIPLFRQNPKGQRGIWACKEHSREPIDPGVEQVTSCIARYKGPRKPKLRVVHGGGPSDG